MHCVVLLVFLISVSWLALPIIQLVQSWSASQLGWYASHCNFHCSKKICFNNNSNQSGNSVRFWYHLSPLKLNSSFLVSSQSVPTFHYTMSGPIMSSCMKMIFQVYTSHPHYHFINRVVCVIFFLSHKFEKIFMTIYCLTVPVLISFQ